MKALAAKNDLMKSSNFPMFSGTGGKGMVLGSGGGGLGSGGAGGLGDGI